MLAVVAAVVVLYMVVLLLTVSELLELFGAADEFVEIEIPTSVIVELLCTASNVMRESAQRKAKQLLTHHKA